MPSEQQIKKQKKYEQYVKSITPSHNLPVNMLKAFVTGGLICLFGQLILNTAQTMGADRETAGNWCSLILILSECTSYRTESVFQDWKVRRRRGTCSDHRFCKLGCLFRDRIPGRRTDLRHRLQDLYNRWSCDPVRDLKFLASWHCLLYSQTYGGDRMNQQLDREKSSLAFQEPVYIQSAASIVGKKEGEGPLRDCFDMVSEDPRFGTDTWETQKALSRKKLLYLRSEKPVLSLLISEWHLPGIFLHRRSHLLLALLIWGFRFMGCMVPAPQSVSPCLSEPCPSQPVTVHISSAPHPVILLLPKRNFVFRSAMETSARSLQPGQ